VEGQTAHIVVVLAASKALKICRLREEGALKAEIDGTPVTNNSKSVNMDSYHYLGFSVNSALPGRGADSSQPGMNLK
jgi:hypothetical protein